FGVSTFGSGFAVFGSLDIGEFPFARHPKERRVACQSILLRRNNFRVHDLRIHRGSQVRFIASAVFSLLQCRIDPRYEAVMKDGELPWWKEPTRAQWAAFLAAWS